MSQKKPTHSIIAFVPLGFTDREGNEVSSSHNIGALWRNQEKGTTSGEADLGDLPRRAGNKFRVAIVPYKEKKKEETQPADNGAF
jgi:hypothetical protein